MTGYTESPHDTSNPRWVAPERLGVGPHKVGELYSSQMPTAEGDIYFFASIWLEVRKSAALRCFTKE